MRFDYSHRSIKYIKQWKHIERPDLIVVPFSRIDLIIWLILWYFWNYFFFWAVDFVFFLFTSLLSPPPTWKIFTKTIIKFCYSIFLFFLVFPDYFIWILYLKSLASKIEWFLNRCLKNSFRWSIFISTDWNNTTRNKSSVISHFSFV